MIILLLPPLKARADTADLQNYPSSLYTVSLGKLDLGVYPYSFYITFPAEGLANGYIQGSDGSLIATNIIWQLGESFLLKIPISPNIMLSNMTGGGYSYSQFDSIAYTFSGGLSASFSFPTSPSDSNITSKFMYYTVDYSSLSGSGSFDIGKDALDGNKDLVTAVFPSSVTDFTVYAVYFLSFSGYKFGGSASTYPLQFHVLSNAHVRGDVYGHRFASSIQNLWFTSQNDIRSKLSYILSDIRAIYADIDGPILENLKLTNRNLTTINTNVVSIRNLISENHADMKSFLIRLLSYEGNEGTPPNLSEDLSNATNQQGQVVDSSINSASGNMQNFDYEKPLKPSDITLPAVFVVNVIWTDIIESLGILAWPLSVGLTLVFLGILVGVFRYRS